MILAAYNPSTSQLSKLTVAIWEYASPASSTNPTLNMSGSPASLISASHAAGIPCVMCILSSWSSNNNNLLINSSLRSQLIANIYAKITQYGFDGVNIDWECDNNTGGGTTITKAQLTAFYAALRSALGSSKIICTAENYGSPALESASAAYIDWIGLMIYDTGSPWYGTLTQWQTGLTTWKNAGFPASKLVGGISFAARLNNSQSSWASYALHHSTNPSDNVYQSYYYNGLTLVNQKAAYVANNDYGGIFVYAPSFDTTDSLSLLNGIVASLATSTNVSSVLATASGLARIPTLSAVTNVAINSVLATASGLAKVPSIAVGNTINSVTAGATGTASDPSIETISGVTINSEVAIGDGSGIAPTLETGLSIDIPLATASGLALGPEGILPFADAVIFITLASASGNAVIQSLILDAVINAESANADGSALIPSLGQDIVITSVCALASGYSPAPVLSILIIVQAIIAESANYSASLTENTHSATIAETLNNVAIAGEQ